jgi:hypothetical protein
MCVATTVAELAAARRSCGPLAIVARRSYWPVVAAVATLAAIARSSRRGHW